MLPSSLYTQSCSHSITLKGEDGDILLDYSKNIITENTMKLLFDLVRATVIYTSFMYHIVKAYYGRNPAYPELTANAMCFNELLLGGISEMS